MKIECSYDKIIKLKDLKEHPDNPNEHPQEQIELLAEIMLKNNIRKPITVSNLSGYIISGHCRYLAAKHNGWDEFPVDFQNYESEAKELEDLTADNKIQELSEFNMSKMNVVFAKHGPNLDMKLCAMPNHIVQPFKKEIINNNFESMENSDSFQEDERLPTVELKGIIENKSEFLIIQFDNNEECFKIKEKLGLSMTRKVINFSDFMKLWK